MPLLTELIAVCAPVAIKIPLLAELLVPQPPLGVLKSALAAK